MTLGLYFVKRKTDRLERVFSLHREFSSFEFIKARNRAYTLLATHPDKTFFDFAQDQSVRDDFEHLLRILTFYEHLSVSVRSHYVDQKAARRYFGIVFVWWYEVYFRQKRGLPTVGWELKEDINELYKHFEKHTDKADFERWMANARDGSVLENALREKRNTAHIPEGSH